MPEASFASRSAQSPLDADQVYAVRRELHYLFENLPRIHIEHAPGRQLVQLAAAASPRCLVVSSTAQR